MGDANTGIKTYEEQMSDFIEAAAHDLHAPLRKLSVLIERIFTKNVNQFDERTKEYIGRMETCIGEMRSLIDGLTELATAEGHSEIMDDCDLDLIVRQVLKNLKEDIEEKHVQVQLGPLPIIKGNAIQYKQLFKNLFENAIKFSSKDQIPEIEVRTGSISGNEKTEYKLSSTEKYYTIEIRDNGIGFKQAHAKKIFEPFVRLHPKSKYGGNGLGLAICKKIVANHQGIIYAEGNEKEGSRFVLILPETRDHTC